MIDFSWFIQIFLGVLRSSVNDTKGEIDKIDTHLSMFCDYRFKLINRLLLSDVDFWLFDDRFRSICNSIISHFGIPGALSIWLETEAGENCPPNGTSHRLKREKGNTWRGIAFFFSKTFHRDEPFHFNSPRNYRKFQSNGKHPRTFQFLDHERNKVASRPKVSTCDYLRVRLTRA